MPTYQYRCPKHHEFDVFFKTFAEAEPHVEETLCDCGETAKRVPSLPLGFGLYGNPEGYYKPSATKRYNTKTVSKVQGNKNAVG